MIKLFDIDKICTVLAFDGEVCRQPNVDTVPNKRVAFSKTIKVAEVPNKVLMSKREKNSLWYPEPVRRSGPMKALQRLFCGASQRLYIDDGDEVSPQGHEDDFENSVLPISAVLTEQENQRDCGFQDPVAIAQVYHKCSAYSAVRAQMRAMEYELDARQYMDRQMWTEVS